MNNKKIFALIGGDMRQAHLVSLISGEGHSVRTYALERAPMEGSAEAPSLDKALEGANYVILPVPCLDGDGYLNAPLSTYRV